MNGDFTSISLAKAVAMLTAFEKFNNRSPYLGQSQNNIVLMS